MQNFETRPEMPENSMFKIPENELEISFERGGGPGGQNVNKLATKATVRWRFQEAPSLTAEQKQLIAENLQSRINKRGELIVSSQEGRSQSQNKEKALEIMNTLVERALTVTPERKETKTPRSAKEKRLEEKKMQAEKKKRRSRIKWYKE